MVKLRSVVLTVRTLYTRFWEMELKFVALIMKSQFDEIIIMSLIGK